MKKLYSVTNFSQGINEYSPQGASDIRNFDITSDGVLETRRGWVNHDALSTMPFQSHPETNPVKQIFFANGKLFVQTTASATVSNLYYRTAHDTFAKLTNNTGLTDPGTLNVACSGRFSVVVADNNRVFLTNTQANGQLWIDTNASTPALYKWGIDPPDIESGFTFTTPSGQLGEGQYAYAFAYEGLFGAMSPLSARKLIDLSDGGSVSIDLPDPSGLDAQIQNIIIYRTEKVTQVAFTEGQTYEQVMVENAPLKQIASVATGDMDAGHSDSRVSIGLAPLAGQLEGAAKPPNYLLNTTLYGGRIWGSVAGGEGEGSSDQLVFSALDETAAPLYDVFPNESSVIPHIVNVRDEVTGIGASRDYLAVFSKNSIQLVRGQGVISGIYGKQQPGTDLDLSQYLTLMGAKDEQCIAESLGNVYFYSPNDQRIYRIDRDGNVAWISQAIEGLLNSLERPNDSYIEQLVAHEGSIYVARRSGEDVTLLQFDELRDQWTAHSLGNVSMKGFTSNTIKMSDFDLGLYAFRDISSPYVVKVFPHGQTSDNSSAITQSYVSQEFAFTKPTRLDAVRIGTESEQSPATENGVSLDLYADGVKTPVLNQSLSKSNNFTIRTFQRGYKHKVGFTLSGAQTVRFFELQFRSR